MYLASVFVALLGSASAFAAATAPANSVRIKVGSSFVIGQHITVTITGFATSPANELDVFNTPGHRCAATVAKENAGFEQDNVLSVLVAGHFKRKVKGTARNLGRSYVCAYVDGFPNGDLTATTYAHAGKYWTNQ